MPDTWLREHPDATLDEIREEVSRLHYQALRARIGARVALAALVFSILSAALVWVYADRVADQAKADAVAEAESAREEADRGLCSLIGDFIRADNPARDTRLRRSLEEAYTDPKCQPPLVDGKLPPLPTPTANPTQAPTTPPATQEPTEAPTDPPGGQN